MRVGRLMIRAGGAERGGVVGGWEGGWVFGGGGGGGGGKGGLAFSSECDLAEPIKINSAVFDNYTYKMPMRRAKHKRGKKKNDGRGLRV